MKKKNSMDISVFDYEIKEKHPIYVSKRWYEEKHVDLLLIGKESKRSYVLIKEFNASKYDYTLHCKKKNIFAVIVYKLLVQKKY